MNTNNLIYINIREDVLNFSILDEHRRNFSKNETSRKLYCVSLLKLHDESCGACVLHNKKGHLIAETAIPREHAMVPNRLGKIVVDLCKEDPPYGITVAIPEAASKKYLGPSLYRLHQIFSSLGISELTYIFVKGSCYRSPELYIGQNDYQ